MEELQNKVTVIEDQKKEISRNNVAAESEFDKQKALLDQKIDFLEKEVADLSKREKDLTIELRNSKKEFLNQNKENSQQLEKQIKD